MTTPAPIGPVSKQKFLATRNTQTDSWCRYEPVKCVLQQIKEIGFFVGAYIVLVLVATNFDFTKLPSLQQLAKFSVVFVAIGYSARLMSDSLGDKVSIAAMNSIGAKTVSLVFPKFISW